MDFKDLMVGDWVSYCGFYNKVIYIGQKVSMYDGKGTEFTTDTEHIRPIPLTEDILVKNGFLKRSDNEYYLKDDIVIFVGSDSCEVCTLYGECTAYSYVEEGYTTVATIHYVHQLQHLLRLCGLKKEIEL